MPKISEDEHKLTSNTSTGQGKTQETIYEESLELSKNTQSIIPFMEDEIVRLEEEWLQSIEEEPAPEASGA